MEVSNRQKQLVREWWETNRDTYLTERSIDKVYKDFQTYHTESAISDPPMNKYIFRTYIRKNGYKNSSVVLPPPKKIKNKK